MSETKQGMWDMLTVKEAADYMRCSTKTVRRMINQGDLKAYYLSPTRHTIRIYRKDIHKVQRPVTPLADMAALDAELRAAE